MNDYNNYIKGSPCKNEFVKSVGLDTTIELLSEYDLNEIAYAAAKAIPSSPSFEALGAYIRLDDTSYSLYVPVKAFGINSLLKGEVSFDFTQKEFTIGIREAKIGKLKISNALADFIISFFSRFKIIYIMSICFTFFYISFSRCLKGFLFNL